MGERTSIEWTDHTFNPWIGCTKVSPGCDHCYAEGEAKRRGWAKWGLGEPRYMTSADYWKQPVKWNRAAYAAGDRRRVFCASLADVFDNEVPDAWRMRLWDLISCTPHLTWLLLTKRIGNAPTDFPSNVWIGASIVNQQEADRDIPKLLRRRAPVRFISYEPALGPVDFAPWLPGLNWIICGGESGREARPMRPDWARTVRDQCNAAGVPFFFKQWGEWHADALSYRTPSGECPPQNMRIGKKKSGATLDGREHREFPAAISQRVVDEGLA